MHKLILLTLCLLSINFLAQVTRVDSIVVDGLKKSKISYLKKLIISSPNQVLDTITINDDIIRMIREPAVSHAYYPIDTIPINKIVLKYHIEENITLIPAVDLWSTIDDAVAYHIGINDHNFLGKGYKEGVFINYNKYSVDTKFDFSEFSNRSKISLL